MQTRPDYYYIQSAVLPIKKEKSEIYILLITSRNQTKWIIPKGIVEENLSHWESAEKEAFEEAGINGRIEKKSIGEYEYKKWGGICKVVLYPFIVETEFEDWPEKYFRNRKWFKVDKALKKLKNKKLKELIKQYFKNKEY